MHAGLVWKTQELTLWVFRNQEDIYGSGIQQTINAIDRLLDAASSG